MPDRITNALLESKRGYLEALLAEVTGKFQRLDVGQLVGLYYGCRVQGSRGYVQVTEDCRTKRELYAAMENACRVLLLVRETRQAGPMPRFLKDDPQPTEGA